MCIKTIYLIRHGETQGNLEKRYIGCRTDEPLSVVGISKLERWDDCTLKVYSSPMKRCIQTAEVLFDKCIPILKSNLREIDFGDFEGGNYLELSANSDYQKWIDSGGEMPFPNGESRDNFIARSFEGFLEIIKEETEDKIAIVCHGGNIMAIMSQVTGLDYFDFQVECAGGYELQATIKDTGEIDVISYHRIYSRDNT